MRWVSRALRRSGFAVASPTVICPEHLKTIRIENDSRAMVHVRQTLVFLATPQPGDLSDTCPLDPDMTLEAFVRQTSDAVDTGRRRRGRDTIVIDWKPKGAVVPYALYNHEYSWFPAGSHSQPAFCAEFNCETKTGTFVFEMITPQGFEAAVAFERPGRWHMRSERTLIKYALKKLEDGADRPDIVDGGQRVEWKIVGPRLGRRYVCVVFQQHGVALWKEQLRKASIRGRIDDLIRRPAATSN